MSSNVDDLSINTTVTDIHKEIKNTTLVPDPKNPYSSLPFKKQAALLTVAKTQRVLAILDFSGFSAKQVKSNYMTIQTMLNQDNRLIAKITEDWNVRPNQQNLTSEILQKCRLITTFANTALPDHPITGEDTYFYLGMAINRDNDTMSLRAKPLLLKFRKQGQQDIIIRNILY